MNKKFTILNLIFFCILIELYSQPYNSNKNGNKFISEKQIKSNDNYALFTEIDDFQKVKISLVTKKAWIYYDRESSLTTLLFKQNDTLFTKKAQLKHVLFVDVCYYLSAQYFNDTIRLSCINSNGYVAISNLYYANNRLDFLNDTMVDVNQQIKELADLAYKNNKPVEYLQILEGAQYYEQFLPNAGLYALRLADSLCTDFVIQGEYLKAAQLMDSLETNFYFTTSENIINDCYKIWIKAANYYLNAGMDDACIRLCKLLVDEKIESDDLFLYYGDALFNKNLKAEASNEYKKYMELSNNKVILERVIERINKK